MDKHFIKSKTKGSLCIRLNSFIACVYTVLCDAAWNLDWKVLPEGHYGSPFGKQGALWKVEGEMLNSDSCSNMQ